VAAGGSRPGRFSLEQNHPNPFNPTTMIRFDIPAASFVSLRVYNSYGQEVTTLLNDEYREAGRYDVPFDGSSIGSGVYSYRLTAASAFSDQLFIDVKKMVLIR
jgi:hypothetical protein